MTDQELKQAIYSFVLKGQTLPIGKQPNSITIEDEFEHEGITRVKQCLRELENEGAIQGRDLLSAIYLTRHSRSEPEDDEPPSCNGGFQTHVRRMPPRPRAPQ